MEISVIILASFIWLFSGYVTYKIINYSWECTWYESFGSHYRDDKEFYSGADEFVSTIIFSVGGLITLIMLPTMAKTFDSESRYSYKKGLGMIFKYDRVKVEQHYKK